MDNFKIGPVTILVFYKMCMKFAGNFLSFPATWRYLSCRKDRESVARQH